MARCAVAVAAALAAAAAAAAVVVRGQTVRQFTADATTRFAPVAPSESLLGAVVQTTVHFDADAPFYASVASTPTAHWGGDWMAPSGGTALVCGSDFPANSCELISSGVGVRVPQILYDPAASATGDTPQPSTTVEVPGRGTCSLVIKGFDPAPEAVTRVWIDSSGFICRAERADGVVTDFGSPRALEVTGATAQNAGALGCGCAARLEVVLALDITQSAAEVRKMAALAEAVVGQLSLGSGTRGARIAVLAIGDTATRVLDLNDNANSIANALQGLSGRAAPSQGRCYTCAVNEARAVFDDDAAAAGTGNLRTGAPQVFVLFGAGPGTVQTVQSTTVVFDNCPPQGTINMHAIGKQVGQTGFTNSDLVLFSCQVGAEGRGLAAWDQDVAGDALAIGMGLVCADGDSAVPPCNPGCRGHCGCGGGCDCPTDCSDCPGPLNGTQAACDAQLNGGGCQCAPPANNSCTDTLSQCLIGSGTAPGNCSTTPRNCTVGAAANNLCLDSSCDSVGGCQSQPANCSHLSPGPCEAVVCEDPAVGCEIVNVGCPAAGNSGGGTPPPPVESAATLATSTTAAMILMVAIVLAALHPW